MCINLRFQKIFRCVFFRCGFSSFYKNAGPILKRKKIPFIIFVNTESVGASGYMNWEEIQQISKENYAIGGFSLKDKKGLLYNSFVIKTDSLGNQLSRIDLNNLSSNKLYDLNIKYNNKTKTIVYSGVGDIIENENSEILFINFQEEEKNN